MQRTGFGWQMFDLIGEERRVKPAPFQYERPESIEGVLAVLNQYGEESRILAGG